VQRAQPTTQAATVGARIVASLIDWIVASVIGTAVVIGFWASGTENFTATGVAFAVAFLVYEVVLTTWAGQTVGKRVVGMVVVDAQDGYPDLWHSTIRYVAKTLFPLTLLLPVTARLAIGFYPFVVLASIAFDGYRRGWHDHAAGTTVLWTTTRRSPTTRIAAAARPQPQSQDPPELPTPADLLQTSAFGRYRKRRVRRR